MKMFYQFLSLAVIVLSVAGCGGKKEEASGVPQEEKPKVKLALSVARDVDQTEEYTAIVESDIKNNISSNSPLRIEKIKADVGDRVSKGQVLVQMDASSLRQLKLQLENLKVEFNRMDQLYKIGGVSKAEWDNAKTQFEVNQTAYRNMLENTRLVSPISGVVTARNYDDGDMSGTLPILTIETLSPVKMLINVSETYFPKVRKGMPVKVKMDTYGEEIFEGKMSIVYPTIDADTHTFPIEVTLTNADNRVRPGMFARVTVNFGTENRTVVPDQAVVKQMGAGDHYVYVYKDGTVSHNKVQVGRRLSDEYEIVSGVEPGMQVVVAGQNRLADGSAVEVVK